MNKLLGYLASLSGSWAFSFGQACFLTIFGKYTYVRRKNTRYSSGETLCYLTV